MISAEALTTRALAIADSAMRSDWLRAFLDEQGAPRAAPLLNGVCAASEQGHEREREVLVALARVLADARSAALRDALRTEARTLALGSLALFLGEPTPPSADAPPIRPPLDAKGRTLTLGERKALARRPDRRALENALRDGHPAVIHNVLANPRLTEDHVVRLAATRPNSPSVLVEIAAHPRWSMRPRVRLAVVLNPATPSDVAHPLILLLTAPELGLVVQATELSSGLRAAAKSLTKGTRE
jgi:hypothetical protein